MAISFNVFIVELSVFSNNVYVQGDKTIFSAYNGVHILLLCNTIILHGNNTKYHINTIAFEDVELFPFNLFGDGRNLVPFNYKQLS